MIAPAKIYFMIFGLLTIVGGVMGYVKAGSTASIIAGGISGIALIVDAVAVPWVRYRVGNSSTAASLAPGPYEPYLVIVGAAAVSLGLGQWLRLRPWAAVAAIATGAVGTVLTAAAAVTRMGNANDLTVVAGGSTTYYVGSALGIATGVVIAVAGIIDAQRG